MKLDAAVSGWNSASVRRTASSPSIAAGPCPSCGGFRKNHFPSEPRARGAIGSSLRLTEHSRGGPSLEQFHCDAGQTVIDRAPVITLAYIYDKSATSGRLALQDCH